MLYTDTRYCYPSHPSQRRNWSSPMPPSPSNHPRKELSCRLPRFNPIGRGVRRWWASPSLSTRHARTSSSTASLAGELCVCCARTSLSTASFCRWVLCLLCEDISVNSQFLQVGFAVEDIFVKPVFAGVFCCARTSLSTASLVGGFCYTRTSLSNQFLRVGFAVRGRLCQQPVFAGRFCCGRHLCQQPGFAVRFAVEDIFVNSQFLLVSFAVEDIFVNSHFLQVGFAMRELC